ncbi:uncharacterized protein LOC130985043 [Salvia miltiorrhiza]|uniref:uncharacterized protein LOC130985043 n=1 Tax=Salvia miltiorrhiza TaxID=226208 RepID=UPI0025ABB99E|nr:uncharacterized protein LOC130985043 [Salvia miltiorrhiza]
MAESRHLLHLLLPPSAAAESPAPLDDGDLKLISSNSGIVFRLFLVAFIGVVSVWANHEASKGYAITVINESTNTFLATRFKVFYASNDEATRAAIKASSIIERFLFPDSDGEKNHSTKKVIKSVVIRLVDRDLTGDVAVETDSSGDRDRFVLSVSSRVLEGANFDREMALAIRRGVARVWLWDGAGDAPRNVVDGIVEYLVEICDDAAAPEVLEPPAAAAAVCWDDSSNARSVAELLRRGERRRPGFIGRLNRAMKDGWSDEKLGGALGLPVDKLCAASESLRYKSSSV